MALGIGPKAAAEDLALAAVRQSRLEQNGPTDSHPNDTSPSAAPRQAPSSEDPAAEQDPALDPESSAEEAVPEAIRTAPAEPSFVGLFSGSDVATFRLGSFPERSQRDENAEVRIEADSERDLRLILIDGRTGKDVCELTGRSSGNLAHIDADQPCFAPEGQQSLSARVTEGTAELDGNRLTLEMTGELNLQLQNRELSGDVHYFFEGER